MGGRAYRQTDVMWGALTFLSLFLVINPTSRDAILGFVEHARLRLAVEAPLSYFLVVVLLGSAVLSALIMAFWPRVVEEPKRIQVVRRYFGPADCDLDHTRVSGGLMRELVRYLLPVRVWARFAALRR